MPELDSILGKPKPDKPNPPASAPGPLHPSLQPKDTLVRIMDEHNQLVHSKPQDVDYVLPDHSHLFTSTSNVVPMIGNIKGGRLLMGAKMVPQALPLREPEAQLVRNQAPDGKAFIEHFGKKAGALHADDDGVVTDMDKNSISMRYRDGKVKKHELYNSFPMNRKTYVHNTSVVKIGDQIPKGGLLAHSNYTDKQGNLALGTNLRSAYMVYKGHNFEDAFVMSESGAKKLSSEHMYQHVHEPDDTNATGRKEYVSIFPGKWKPDQIKHIGDDGVIKPGATVKPGDPLVLSLTKGKTDALHRGHKPAWSDGAMTWDHHSDGVVTDVEPTKRGGYNITVKSYNPLVEGDKISGLYGDKGIVSKVVPDHQMIHDRDGKPFDLLLNPQGIITRGNPAQVFEALLGKVARKTGKPYILPSFSDKNMIDFTHGELQKNGLKDTEDVIDPLTGHKIPNVMTGERFTMKLHHIAADKSKARDVAAYTAEGLPARGGELGSKRVGQLELFSLLSHGAVGVIRDAFLVRGQRNDEYWRAIRMGGTPASPTAPFIHQKFMDYLKAAGVNTQKRGDKTHLLSMTDADVDKISKGEITSPDTVHSHDLSEVDGGLFDRKLTGGHAGNSWTHASLATPLPNPVMEEPVRTLLGLTEDSFEQVLSGKKELQGETGSIAIHNALKRIDVDSAIEHHLATIQDGAKSKRDKAVKALGYLKGLKAADLHPADLMMSKVPILPPSMRPITQLGKMLTPADANYLYRDLMTANQGYKEFRDEMGEQHAGEERLNLYKSYRALSGLGDPVNTKTVEKGARGLLTHVFGAGSPKYGMAQRRMLSASVDMVGRAAISPDPGLGMDEVGIPEDKAWTVYRPFIMRNLIRSGMPAMEAAKAVADRKDVAKKVMLNEMDKRPVIITRAPALHRYNFMAFKPKLSKNDTMQLSPVVCGGFNADFDGDQQLNMAIILLTSDTFAALIGDEKTWWSLRKVIPGEMQMAARFKTHVLAFKGFETFVMDLSDVPHAEEFVQKDHIKFHAAVPGMFVPAYDEATGSIVPAPLSGWSEHADRIVEVVTLCSGRQIFTDDDPRGVYGINPRTYKMDRAAPKDSIGFVVPRAVEFKPQVTVTSIPSPNEGRMLPELKLNREFGYVLGCMIGDGWVSHAYGEVKQTCLAGINVGVTDRFFASVKTLFIHPDELTAGRVEFTQSKGESVRYVYNSVELARCLLPLIGRGAEGKHLPPFFLSAPPEFQLGLLEGLLDTDGSVSISNGKNNPQLMTNYCSNSLRLVYEIQNLLRCFGATSRVTASKTPGGNAHWQLGISAKRLQRVGLELGHTKKAQILHDFPLIEDTPASVRVDLVPIHRETAEFFAKLLRSKRGEAGLHKWDKAPSFDTPYIIFRNACEKGLVSRFTVNKYMRQYDWTGLPFREEFTRILENEAVTWDKVESFENTGIKETGYDLTVPGYETFMAADGTILSNTMNYHVPVSDEAVRDAHEKMMPSKNLFSTKDFKVHYLPKNEFLMGLYLATKSDNKNEPRVFATKKDALAAYHRGEIGLGERVEVK